MEGSTERPHGCVLCGVDDSPGADRATVAAARLAERLGVELVLAHVASVRVADAPHAREYAVPGFAELEAAEVAGRSLLEASVARTGLAGKARLRVEVGLPGAALPSLAGDEGAALLVVGSRGRGAFAAATLGSVSASVATRAPCPVVVVPAGARTGPNGRTIVCGVGDDVESRRAVRVAHALAARLGGRLVLVHAVPGGSLPGGSVAPGATAAVEAAARRSGAELLTTVAVEEGLGARVVRRVAFGAPTEALIGAAEEESAALVVVGSRGRRPLAAAVLGSVSHALAGRAPCPVAVVPAGARLAGRRVGDGEAMPASGSGAVR